MYLFFNIVPSENTKYKLTCRPRFRLKSVFPLYYPPHLPILTHRRSFPVTPFPLPFKSGPFIPQITGFVSKLTIKYVQSTDYSHLKFDLNFTQW